MLNLKLAFKNVFRNKKRTLLTLFAITIGNVGILLFLGYMNLSFWGMRESVIRSRLSHVQIYKKGFYENGSVEPYKFMINDYDKIRRILSKEKMVKLITARLGIKGLIASKEQSTVFVGEGVDPDDDNELSSFLRIIKGSDLKRYSSDDIILGSGLAKSMSANTGEGLTLMTTTVDGGINAVDVNVRGIMQTGSKDYDDMSLKIPIKTAQRLLNTGAVTKIMILLQDTENVPVFAQRLQEIIKVNKLNIEFKTWYDLADFYHQTVNMLKNIFLFIMVIICIIVIFSIANTVTMSVMERTQEIGTIRAIGATKRNVLRLFLTEGAIIGLMGGILGLIFGVLSGRLINILDITMLYPGQNTSYPIKIYINLMDATACFLSSIAVSVLSSVLPAIRASGLVIADAFRNI